MPILLGHDEDVSEWASRKLGGSFLLPHAAMGMLDKNGVLKGAFVLTFQNEHTAELTLYSEGVMTNGMWAAFFRWAFLHFGIYRLQIRTSRRNKPIKRSAPKFGFIFQGVDKGFWGPGEDALVFFMTPNSCRWLKQNDDSERSQRAA